MVLKNPFDPKEERLNHDIFERFFSHIDIVKSRKEFVKGIQEEVFKDIENRIKQLNPDLIINFNQLYIELTSMIKDFQGTINTIERKSKKLFESSSLTEDVYKTRDELKELKKKIDKLNTGLKKFARLSDVISE